jgi:hypothetical protein
VELAFLVFDEFIIFFLSLSASKRAKKLRNFRNFLPPCAFLKPTLRSTAGDLPPVYDELFIGWKSPRDATWVKTPFFKRQVNPSTTQRRFLCVMRAEHTFRATFPADTANDS